MNFDLNFKEIVDKMCKIADKRFPKRNWLLNILCWDDTDFRIRLDSGWGRIKDRFEYRKSDNTLKWFKISVIDKIEDNEVWRKETSRRHGLIAQYFKPKENQIILDFIRTGEDVSKEEKEASEKLVEV